MNTAFLDSRWFNLVELGLLLTGAYLVISAHVRHAPWASALYQEAQHGLALLRRLYRWYQQRRAATRRDDTSGLYESAFFNSLADRGSSLWYRATRDEEKTLPATAQQESSTGAALSTDHMLDTARWLHLVNEQPDGLPHLLILGGSGSGKSTLTRALLASRHGQIVIVTPKEEDSALWSLPIMTTDADGTFTTIAATLDSLLSELMRRVGATEQLTVVLDDYALIACDKQTKEAARDLVLRVARIGRSRRMRLIVLADASNAATLGITGEAASLNNFATISVDRQRRATLTHDEQRYQLDTRQALRLASQALRLAPWLASERTNERTNERPESGIGAPFVRPENRDDVIALLVHAGWTTTKIREVVKGEAAAIGDVVKRLKEAG
jgi:energy-coupling factor transporter ATP-binding protein EcfA2